MLCGKFFKGKECSAENFSRERAASLPRPRLTNSLHTIIIYLSFFQTKSDAAPPFLQTIRAARKEKITMAKHTMSAAERQAHKKLIAPNIVITLLCWAAAVSLILCPWLDMRVPVNQDLAAAVVDSMGPSADIDEDQLNFIVKDVDSEVRVTLSPLQLLEAGTSEGRQGLKNMLEEVLAEATSTVDEIVQQALPAALSTAIINTVLEELPAGFTYEDVKIPQEMNDTVNKLAEKTDPEEIKSELKGDFISAAESFVAQNSALLGIGELSEEDRAQLESIFEEAVDLMTVDGEFSLSNIDKAIAELMNSYGGSLEESGMQPFAVTFAAAREATSGNAAIDFIRDPGAYVDSLSETDVQLIKAICLWTAVFMLFIAVLWAILSLFAFIHIFTPNKKVGMWYVKATGYLPCLLFVVAPAIAMTALPTLMPEFPALGITFGGLVLISGACYIALWLVSAIWCHIVRKQIDKAAYAARMAAAAAAAADAAAPALAGAPADEVPADYVPAAESAYDAAYAEAPAYTESPAAEAVYEQEPAAQASAYEAAYEEAPAYEDAAAEAPADAAQADGAADGEAPAPADEPADAPAETPAPADGEENR